MDRRRFAVAGVLAVMLGAGLTVAGCSSDDSSSSGGDQAASTASESSGGTYGSDRSPGGDDSSDDQSAAGSDKAGGNSSKAGQYVDYSPELVSSTPGDKLLFFHADWCSQCVSLEGDIESSGVPDGVTIFKVDYDSNQDLRQEYGVTIQTTVVKVDDKGDKIDSYVAYEDPTIDNVTAALIQ
jgi:thiol-disulfide isomerase/thioredoxin